jgi:hypothetical protein
MAKVTVYPFIASSSSESDNIREPRYGTEKAIAEVNGVKSGDGIEIDEAELDETEAITSGQLRELKLISW